MKFQYYINNKLIEHLDENLKQKITDTLLMSFGYERRRNVTNSRLENEKKKGIKK